MSTQKMFVSGLLLAALLLLIVPVTVAQDDPPAEPLIESACLVTDIGRVNDGTFNQFAFEGFTRAAEDFDIDTTFIETQAQADYVANIATCLDEGFEAIITVGFLIQDATLEAAEANPDVFFIGVDQFYNEGAPANVVGLQFREDQSGFLAGAMAALMTESGTVAGVYGVNVPAVIKFRNGYEQGARFINEDIITLGVYIDSFTAPDRGATAAEQFIGEGADVIFGAGGQTGSGAITRAAQEGVMVIGVDQDEYFTTFGNGETPGAENLITSATKRVDQAVYLSLEALVMGDAEAFGGGGNRVFSAENEGVGLAPSHDAQVPQSVQDQLDEIFAGLADGSIETGVDAVSGELLDMMDEDPAEMEPTEEAGA
ncbi:MAG: BMP family ABC transporter substrate-binding protein [Chloroflexi bacterium]|nr:BMP family ABC transporter substrate-binding protein [Chloroflexota bacterium]